MSLGKELAFLKRAFGCDWLIAGFQESLVSFYGYELKFQSFEDAEPTCIRVLPNYEPSERPDTYVSRIKSFISQ